MAQQIYSKLLLVGQCLTPGPPLTYHPPPGTVAVVRDIIIWASLGVAAGELFWVDENPKQNTWMWSGPSGGGVYTDQWTGRQVYPYVDGIFDGFFLQGANGTNTWNVRVSGYELTAP